MTVENQQHDTPRVGHHVFLATILESLLAPLGVDILSEVNVMGAPPKADVLILRRHGASWNAAQKAWLPDGIRQTSASRVLIELKATQSLNRKTLAQTVSYDHHYQQSQSISARGLHTVLVLARTPHKTTLKNYLFHPTRLNGVYVSTYPLCRPIRIIVLNKLANTAYNACFKLFASRLENRRLAAQVLYQQVWQTLPQKLQYILITLFELWYQKEKGEYHMEFAFTPELMERAGKQIFDSYVASLPIKERIAGVPPEELLNQFDPETRLKGLDTETILKGIDPDILEAYLIKLRSNN